MVQIRYDCTDILFARLGSSLPFWVSVCTCASVHSQHISTCVRTLRCARMHDRLHPHGSLPDFRLAHPTDRPRNVKGTTMTSVQLHEQLG